MGDDKAPSAGKSTRQIVQAVTEYLPELSQIFSDQILPVEQAQLAAQQVIEPGRAQLSQEMYDTFGREMARIGDEILAESQIRGAENDARYYQGAGRDSMQAQLAAAKAVDPEFYNAREVTGQAIDNLLRDYDPTQLSGSELAMIERGLNRSNIERGVDNTGSQQALLSNAMTFGDAINQRRMNLGNAIMQASQSMQGLRSGIFENAQAKAPTAQFGTGQYSGVQIPTFGGPTTTLTTSMLGEAGAAQQAKISADTQRETTWDRIAGFL